MFRKEVYRECFFRIAIGILALVLVTAGGAGATKFINDNATGGDCTSTGTWDVATKTCTLTNDLNEAIQIDSNDITLNGGGRTVTGNSTGSGVNLTGRTGVIIKNLNVKNFSYGIYLGYSSNNTLSGNNASYNNDTGIELFQSNNNTLLYNNASYNNDIGIELFQSGSIMMIGNNASNNLGIGVLSYQAGGHTLKNNILNSNRDGIFFRSSIGSTLINNIANSNYYNGIYIFYFSAENNITNNTANLNGGNGIVLGFADSNNMLLGNKATNNNNNGIHVFQSGINNTVTGNNASNNNNSGIYAAYSHDVRVTGNTASNNSYGIYLQSSSNNTIYNNIFNNTNNAVDNGNNTWNITKTAGTNIIGGAWLGGNYWSDYAGKDLDGDGLGDTLLPYNSSGNITNGGDFLPLAIASTTTAGSISGFKIEDLNGNGRWDEGEKGLKGWNIKLTGIVPETADINMETTTDDRGFYSFENLPSGKYLIKETVKGGYVPNSPAVLVVDLENGKNSMNNNFMNIPVSSLTEKVR